MMMLALKPSARPVSSSTYGAALSIADSGVIREQLGLPKRSKEEAEALLYKKALDVCKENGIDVFDSAAVDTFLGKIARRKTGLFAVLTTKPSRWIEGDRRLVTYFKGQWYARWISADRWQGVIPVSVLTKMKTIRDAAFKGGIVVRFEIGEIVEGEIESPRRDPDPFIRAVFGDVHSISVHVVFDVWDEPKWK